MDGFCPNQYSIHESTNEGAGGVDNEPEETLQIGSESLNKQVSHDKWDVFIWSLYKYLYLGQYSVPEWKRIRD